MLVFDRFCNYIKLSLQGAMAGHSTEGHSHKIKSTLSGVSGAEAAAVCRAPWRLHEMAVSH